MKKKELFIAMSAILAGFVICGCSNAKSSMPADNGDTDSISIEDDADIDLLVIPDGEYDEESGWIKNMARVGVLRPNESGEQKYKITNYGTGF